VVNQIWEERDRSGSGGSKAWVWILILLIVVGVAGYFAYQMYKEKNSTATSSKTTSSGEKITISQKILDNKFGWLGGGADDDGSIIVESGGAWVRPHPGAFVWDMMQKSANAEIDFTAADKEVKSYEKNNLGILVTIWPFADWDQKDLANAADCKVASNDEFLAKNDEKGRGSYLPEYRCNPGDWKAYQEFVEKIVERYDGDGINDMPGLTIPIKYWEVMNEPDLQYQNTQPAGATKSLTFYKQGPTEYADLLIKTSVPIRSADPDAKILIAGAAGADPNQLGFYKSVFTNKETISAFDIGNIHCISNDQKTHDFNVAPYKSMLDSAGVSGKPIWVTEAEAMYGKSGDENYQTTKTSTAGALAAGAAKIFFTRYELDDTRTDMSKKSEGGTYPSAEKYAEIIKSSSN